MYKTQSFKKKILVTAVASVAMSGFIAPAFAQEEDTEVVITGIRASLERSMDVKRNSSGVVDAISSEDIGKMPDANLAESLQRIAGVSITRTNGEGARVTVRGIDPAMNMVTLNGRVMPTVTNDGGDGDRASRAFDFASLASESVSGVEVYKTGKAGVSGGGLGANINLKTARPLDVGDTKASVAVKGVEDTTVHRGSSGRQFTPEVSGIYSWANEESTFGVALSAAYQERDNLRSNAFVNNWQLREIDEDGNGNSNLENLIDSDPNAVINKPGANSLYAIPTDLRYSLEDNHRERTNGQLTLQFRPIDSLTGTVDYTFTEYDLQAKRAQQSTWFNESAIVRMEFDRGQEVATPLIYVEEYLTSDGKDVSFAQQKYDGSSTSESLGFNLGWDVTDSFKLAFDYHDSKAKNYTTRTEIGLNANIVTEEYADWSKDLPVMGVEIDDSNPAKGNNNGILDGGDVSSAMGSVRWDTQDAQVEQLKLDGALDLGGFAFFEESKVSFGVDSREDQNQAVVSNGESPRITMGNWGGVDPETFGPYWANYFSPRDFAKAYPSFGSTTGDSHFFTGGIDGDIDKIIGAIEAVYLQGLSDPAIAANFNNFPSGKIQSNDVVTLDRTINEEVTGFYGEIQGRFKLGGMESGVVLGLRHEKTDLTSTALVLVPTAQVRNGNNDWFLQFDNTVPVNYSLTNSYNSTLPSLDFDISFTDDIKGRFSASKTIARPAYGSLSAASGITNQYLKQATSGNPLLEPLKSTNLDVSVEWYYSDSSYASIGLFSKKVEDFIGTGVGNDPIYGLRDQRNGARFEQAQQLVANGTADTSYARTDSQDWDWDNEQHQYELIQMLDRGITNHALVQTDGYNIVDNSGDPIQLWANSKPSNQEDDKITGVELSVMHWFGESGFGVQANYTAVESDLEVDNTETEEQFAMLGVSDTLNLSAFYDANGLQARIAYNWRDAYLFTTAMGGNNAPGYVDEFAQIDLSVSYDVTDNVVISLEGLNVTGEDSRIYGRSERQMFSAEDLGARYAMGVRYTF